MDVVIDVLSRPGASAGAILFSALSAGLFALVAVWMNRRTTKERETIVLINNFMWDEDFLKAKKIFIRVRDTNAGLESCTQDPDSEEARAVSQIMNHYELLSVGINTGILSSKVYARFYKTRFVKDWLEAEAYVHSKRRVEGNQKIFVDFEKLAKKWGADKLRSR